MANRVTRREFLQTGTAAMAGGIALGQPGVENAKPQNSTYETETTDTLDLAERGAFAINALTGAADPGHGYESYLCGHLDQRPPYMSHRFGGPCMQKPVHALPMMRVMTGSTLNRDYDGKMMEAIVRDIDDQGLWWLKTEGRPYRAETFKQDFVMVCSSGRFMAVLADWYRYDHDTRWLAILERMAHGLDKIAIEQDGYTLYHDSYLRLGWPDLKKSPFENPQIYVNGLVLRGFTQRYALSGDKRALEMAEKLAKYIQSPAVGTWKPSEGPLVAGSEQAHWDGHFHSHTTGMIGLMEYANQVNDGQAKRFVENFYEYSRSFGIARMGFFPLYVMPLARQIKDSQVAEGMPDEGCAVADMTLIAILLSDGGVGDYWDDVDQYVRNHLIEHQVLRRDLLEAVIASGQQHSLDPRMETDDHALERQLGAFTSLADPTLSYPQWTMCCLGNCSVAIYKAWESTLRFKDGIAQVNLLLNRASDALDIDSYIPNEGKVVLKNKLARKAFVRVPAWVDKSAVVCRVNDRRIPSHWLNNYLMVEGLAPKDLVTLEFPMVETIEEHTEPRSRQQYTCRFRGNTLMEISPQAARPVCTHWESDDGAEYAINKGYPLYQRESYKEHKAPMKRVQRYVSPVLI